LNKANTKNRLTIDDRVCPIEPQAIKYPNAVDRCSAAMVCANIWNIVGRP